MANLGKLFATLNQTYVDSGIAHVSQIVRDLVLSVRLERAPWAQSRASWRVLGVILEALAAIPNGLQAPAPQPEQQVLDLCAQLRRQA